MVVRGLVSLFCQYGITKGTASDSILLSKQITECPQHNLSFDFPIPFASYEFVEGYIFSNL